MKNQTKYQFRKPNPLEETESLLNKPTTVSFYNSEGKKVTLTYNYTIVC